MSFAIGFTRSYISVHIPAIICAVPVVLDEHINWIVVSVHTSHLERSAAGMTCVHSKLCPFVHCNTIPLNTWTMSWYLKQPFVMLMHAISMWRKINSACNLVLPQICPKHYASILSAGKIKTLLLYSEKSYLWRVEVSSWYDVGHVWRFRNVLIVTQDVYRVLSRDCRPICDVSGTIAIVFTINLSLTGALNWKA